MNSYYKWLYGDPCGCGGNKGGGKGNCTCEQIFSAITEIQNEINNIDLSEYWTSAETVSAITEIVYDALDDLELELDEKEQVVAEALHYLYHNKLSIDDFYDYKTNQDIINNQKLDVSAYTASTVVDSQLDSGSTHPVSNSAITVAINAKLDKSTFNVYSASVANNYALKTDIPSDVSAFNNDVPYLTSADTSNYVTNNYLSSYTYSKTEIDNKIASGGTFDPTQYYTTAQTYSKTEVDNLTSGFATVQYVDQSVSGKQNTLVSGVSIKTINNESLLGSGNITISGGSQITIDSQLDSGSTNPVANSAITAALNLKADKTEIPVVPTSNSAFTNDMHYLTSADTTNYQTKLSAGTNVTISGNVISATVPTSNSAFTNDMHYLTSADTATYVTSGNVETQITNHFYCCSEQEWSQISGSTNPNTLYLIY